jgi:uncharacterized delta-60 repeat protein
LQRCSPPLAPLNIVRWWGFNEYFGNDRTLRAVGPGMQLMQSAGVLDEQRELGGLTVIPPGQPDPIARLRAHSSESGMTYWAGAQTPAGRPNDGNPVGGESLLEQTQTLRKVSANATLEYVVSQVLIEAIDNNPFQLTPEECPWRQTSNGLDRCEQALAGEVHFNFSAWADLDPTGRVAYETPLVAYEPSVYLNGWRGNWDAYVDYDWYPLWDERDFIVEYDVGFTGNISHARIRLKSPLVIKVPLDAVPLGGEIMVSAKLVVRAFNQRQRESYVGSWFRDPAQAGGLQVRMSGLEPAPLRTSEPLPAQPQDGTPACTGAADPAAGVLQFERADFSHPELPTAGARIVITRTGGAAGEVSVGFHTSENTAKAGADFVHVDRRVRFRDGETRRTVHVPIVTDGAAELDEVLGLELFDVRGCAALGAQSSAALTIVDDDRIAPTPQRFRVGGTVSGLAAGATLRLEDRGPFIELTVGANGAFEFPYDYAANAGYDVRVQAHPAGPLQRCTVSAGRGVVTGNVGDIAVTCTDSPAPAGLDPGFGHGGRAVGGLPGGAKAIALQSDGRIVAGSASILARYHADGRLDTGFGQAGLVGAAVGGVFGGGSSDQIADLVVQPDGRIVAVGRVQTDLTSALSTDFAAARFMPDGTRDTTFGSGGIVRVDFIGAPDEATRVLLQPDGKLVLAGIATTLLTPTHDDADFGVVRLNADGSLDPGFGIGGRASVHFAGLDFAYAAALQADGAIVVAGRVSDSRADEADIGIARLLADGTLDAAFDGDGRLRLDLSPTWDEAIDLAVQSDGRIVVAAAASAGGNFTYTLLRLLADGSLDPTFGNGGRVDTDIGARGDTPQALALQADGRIVVAGSASSATVNDFGLVRYLSDGTLDAGFGTGGVLLVDFFGALDSANDVRIQSDGAIVAAGFVRNVTTGVTGLVRVLP